MKKKSKPYTVEHNAKGNFKLHLFKNTFIELTPKESIYSKTIASVTPESRFIIHHMNVTLTYILHQ